MKYHKRKPDLDLESFRAWIPTKEETEELKKEVKGISIKYKDIELQLTGFSIAYADNRKKKPIFAWKFKHENKMVMYYCFDIKKLPTKELRNQAIAVKKIKDVAEMAGYGTLNMEEQFKSVYLEMQTLENMRKKKNEN